MIRTLWAHLKADGAWIEGAWVDLSDPPHRPWFYRLKARIHARLWR